MGSVAQILSNNVVAGYGDYVISAYDVAVKMITMEFMIVYGYVSGMCLLLDITMEHEITKE